MSVTGSHRRHMFTTLSAQSLTDHTLTYSDYHYRAAERGEGVSASRVNPEAVVLSNLGLYPRFYTTRSDPGVR